MRSKPLAIAALMACTGLAACATDGAGGPNGYPYMGGPDNFGEANRVTMAAQVVDPVPEYDTALPEHGAEHAGQAAERYRTDKVKKPDKVRISKTATEGGGSGGGN